MRGGTMQPVLLMVHLVVVVPWLCLASSAALLPAPALAVAAASENGVHAASALKAEYIKLNFSTASATPDKYKTFIASVRAGLVSKAGGNSSGIPVLLSEDDPLALESFLIITLVNKARRSVTLKMDVATAGFVAYEAGNYSCLLKRSGRAFSSAICYQSASSAAVTLPRRWSTTRRGRGRGGRYLVGVAAGNNATKDLDEAISSLFLFPTGNATKEELSRGVAVCDMMIAAAAAFPYVERRISAGLRESNGVAKDPTLLGLQATWPSLSAAVQDSHQGAFAAPVAVQRSNGKWMQVDNVRRAVPLVSFLEYHSCNKTPEPEPEAVDQQVPLLIRPAVVQDMQQLGDGGAAAACGEAEPTVQLAGPEGRCVDVPYYYNGIQVQLLSCKPNGDAAVNQLWTLKRDGTIRSNGKCLTSTGNAAGARVVIDDCPASVPTAAGRVVWEVRTNGTIALKGSRGSLVLAAVASSTFFAPLTVQVDDGGTGQSWTPTNDTAPMDAAIVGFRNLCLHVDTAGAVSVASCRDGGGSGGGVQWSIYPDGSIRPPAWLLLQWQCLAADASGRVTVKLCDGAGSSGQRWVFRNDGTVFNAGTGMVLDFRPATTDAAANASQVIVSPVNSTRSPTQQWTLML